MAPKVPPFALFYAAIKVGKTTAILKAFPGAHVIGERGAVEPLCDQWQIPYPSREDPQTIHTVVESLRKRNKGDRTPLNIDDLSLVMDSTIVAFEKNPDMRAVYGDMHKAIIKLRDIAQDLSIPVIMNCHEKAPETKDGRTIPGGPALPGKSGAAIGAGVQTLARAARTASRKRGFPVVFKHDPKDASYPTGDRHGVLFNDAPMNPRAMYVAAGYELPRAKGLEWQDDIMFEGAEAFLQLDAKSKTFDKDEISLIFELKSLMEEAGRAAPHIAWAIEDARDLAAFVRRREQNLFQFL